MAVNERAAVLVDECGEDTRYAPMSGYQPIVIGPGGGGILATAAGNTSRQFIAESENPGHMVSILRVEFLEYVEETLSNGQVGRSLVPATVIPEKNGAGLPNRIQGVVVNGYKVPAIFEVEYVPQGGKVQIALVATDARTGQDVGLYVFDV
jgi:hypothetical protein